MTLSAPVKSSPRPAANSINVPKEMVKLSRMTIQELRAKYRELYGAPTMVAHKVFLRKRIIWKMQSIAENLDLNKEDWALVNSLAQYAPIRMRPKRKTRKARIEDLVAASSLSSPNPLETPNQRDSRIPPPGSILRRYHNGKTYEVLVLDDGFEYQGKWFKSLTGLAKHLTGTHWNGYAFFIDALAKARTEETK